MSGRRRDRWIAAIGCKIPARRDFGRLRGSRNSRSTITFDRPMPRSGDRSTPVGREQRPRSIPEPESPEPGEETGPSVVGTTVFDRMPARLALASGVIGIWLDGRLGSVDGFTLETQHHGSSGRKVELTRFESLSVYHPCIQDRSRSSCRDGEAHASHRLSRQLVAAQEHMLLAPVEARDRQ